MLILRNQGKKCENLKCKRFLSEVPIVMCGSATVLHMLLNEKVFVFITTIKIIFFYLRVKIKKKL